MLIHAENREWTVSHNIDDDKVRSIPAREHPGHDQQNFSI